MTAALADRIACARAAWRDVEQVAAAVPDDELDGRVAIARLAILDVADRVAQLHGDGFVDWLERELHGAVEELELERYGDPDEAAA